MATYEPLLTDWELLFDMTDGYGNRLEVMQDFARFWGDPAQKKITFLGRCSIGGTLTDLKVEDFSTTSIKSIHRIRIEGNRVLMRAMTTGGYDVCFYSDEMSGYMAMMLSDLKSMGALNPRRHFYSGHNRYGSNFI